MNTTFGAIRAMGDIKGKKSRSQQKVSALSWDTEVRKLERVSKLDCLGVIPLLTFRPVTFPYQKIERAGEMGLAFKNFGEWTKKEYSYPIYDDWGSTIDFRRMLCKIAHGYWVAERGLKNFIPYLPLVIKNQTECGLDNFVGSMNADPELSSDLHDLTTGEVAVNGYLYGYVDIGLFNCYRVATTYRVIVGSIGPRFMEVIIPPDFLHDKDWKPEPAREILLIQIE
ncbi:hypothetical protein U1769_15165 [Sphingomonas sp. ZT3P38]|uniref:hypothetical protein n=1 Tax=Parasphingomonas zepuensis TaxID=3096161 RepID=UPI002FCC9975